MKRKIFAFLLCVCTASSLWAVFTTPARNQEEIDETQFESALATPLIEEVDEMVEKPAITRERVEELAMEILAFPETPEVKLLRNNEIGKLFYEVSLSDRDIWIEIDARTGKVIRLSDPRGLRSGGSDWENLAREILRKFGWPEPVPTPKRNKMGQLTELYWDMELAGIPVLGGRISVVFDPVIEAPIKAGVTWVQMKSLITEPSLSEEAALSVAAEEISKQGWDDIYTKIEAVKLVFARPIYTERFGLEHRLTWATYLSNPTALEEGSTMVRVLVDAVTGEVIGLSRTR